MGAENDSGGWNQVIDGMIDRRVAGVPTEPGIYRLPCGECYVDFYIGPDGSEHTREPVAATRHGEHP